MPRTHELHGGKDPRTVPAYTIGEVAEYLHLPRGTVRNWTVGMRYRSAGASRRFEPVIKVASASEPRLSFENLIEVHVLGSLRRRYDVRLDAVRRAVGYLRREMRSEHPLAEAQMLTDGVNIFVERYGRLVNASAEGQQAMSEIVRQYLARIERDPVGRSMRLYPVTRSSVEPSAAPRLVAIDPTIRFGQPFLVGCGVETRVIAGRLKAGDSVHELARDLGVSEDAIEEAIRYALPSAA